MFLIIKLKKLQRKTNILKKTRTCSSVSSHQTILDVLAERSQHLGQLVQRSRPVPIVHLKHFAGLLMTIAMSVDFCFIIAASRTRRAALRTTFAQQNFAEVLFIEKFLDLKKILW